MKQKEKKSGAEREFILEVTDLTTKLQLASELMLQADPANSLHILIMQVKKDGTVERVCGDFGMREVIRNGPILESSLRRIISTSASTELKPANKTELRAFVREAKQRYGVCEEMTKNKLGTCPESELLSIVKSYHDDRYVIPADILAYCRASGDVHDFSASSGKRVWPNEPKLLPSGGLQTAVFRCRRQP
jgi:hypothetical protein